MAYSIVFNNSIIKSQVWRTLPMRIDSVDQGGAGNLFLEVHSRVSGAAGSLDQSSVRKLTTREFLYPK